MKNIVCLISGRGSNLEAILKTAQAQDWRTQLDAQISVVVSNRPNVQGLKIARDFGVAQEILDHRAFETRDAFDAALAGLVDGYEPTLVVLAGFMRVLTEPFVERYMGRLINIHPSLLPAFPGLATHRKALEAGVRVHGATVHYVSRDVDAGAIIGQAVVPVLPDDTEETLAARVLEQEHVLLPRCLQLILEQKVALKDRHVWCDKGVAEQLLVRA